MQRAFSVVSTDSHNTDRLPQPSLPHIEQEYKSQPKIQQNIPNPDDEHFVKGCGSTDFKLPQQQDSTFLEAFDRQRKCKEHIKNSGKCGKIHFAKKQRFSEVDKDQQHQNHVNQLSNLKYIESKNNPNPQNSPEVKLNKNSSQNTRVRINHQGKYIINIQNQSAPQLDQNSDYRLLNSSLLTLWNKWNIIVEKWKSKAKLKSPNLDFFKGVIPKRQNNSNSNKYVSGEQIVLGLIWAFEKGFNAKGINFQTTSAYLVIRRHLIPNDDKIKEQKQSFPDSDFSDIKEKTTQIKLKWSSHKYGELQVIIEPLLEKKFENPSTIRNLVGKIIAANKEQVVYDVSYEVFIYYEKFKHTFQYSIQTLGTVVQSERFLTSLTDNKSNLQKLTFCPEQQTFKLFHLISKQLRLCESVKNLKRSYPGQNKWINIILNFTLKFNGDKYWFEKIDDTNLSYIFKDLEKQQEIKQKIAKKIIYVFMFKAYSLTKDKTLCRLIYAQINQENQLVFQPAQLVDKDDFAFIITFLNFVPFLKCPTVIINTCHGSAKGFNQYEDYSIEKQTKGLKNQLQAVLKIIASGNYQIWNDQKKKYEEGVINDSTLRSKFYVHAVTYDVPPLQSLKSQMADIIINFSCHRVENGVLSPCQRRLRLQYLYTYGLARNCANKYAKFVGKY